MSLEECEKVWKKNWKTNYFHLQVNQLDAKMVDISGKKKNLIFNLCI